MGRQVNFYLSDDDQIALTKKMDELGTILAASTCSTSVDVRVHSVFSFSRFTPEFGWPLLFRPEDKDNLIIESSRLTVPDFGMRYYIERWRNPVVEFSTCIQRENEILRGRLFFQSKYFDSATGIYVEKSPEFVAWATKLFGLVKKSTKKDSRGIYIGEGAAALEKNGYSLCQ